MFRLTSRILGLIYLLAAAPAFAQSPPPAPPHISTISGVRSNGGFVDGVGTGIRMDTPRALATDKFGNIYVAEVDNHVVRKLTRQGNSYTSSVCAGRPGLRGNNVLGVTGSAPTWLGEGRLSAPVAVAVDPVLDDGSKVYIASGHGIVVANCAGSAGFLTGEVYGGIKGDLLSDGLAPGCVGNPDVRFNKPSGLAFFRSPSPSIPTGRYLFVSDTLNHKIKMIDLNNCAVRHIAGSTSGHRNGDAYNVLGSNGSHEAKFDTPRGITYATFFNNFHNQGVGASEGPMNVGEAGRAMLFVADSGNESIRAIQLRWNKDASSFFGVSSPSLWWDTRVHTVAGAVAQEGVPSPGRGSGDARYDNTSGRWFSAATVDEPHTVHFVANAGVVTDPHTQTPRAVSYLLFNSGANIRYVMFVSGSVSRPAQWPITSPPYLFTFVPSAEGFANGQLEAPNLPQRFDTPYGIAGTSSSLVVADVWNHQVREIRPTQWLDATQIAAINSQPVNTPHIAGATGNLSSLAGWAPTYRGAQGAPAEAAFWNSADMPGDLAVDPESRYVFAADSRFSRILRIDPLTGPQTPPVLLAAVPEGVHSIAIARIGTQNFLFVGLGNGRIRRYKLTPGYTLGASIDSGNLAGGLKIIALAVGNTLLNTGTPGLRGYFAAYNRRYVKRFDPATLALYSPTPTIGDPIVSGYVNNVDQPYVTSGTPPFAAVFGNPPLFENPQGLAIHPLEDSVLVSGQGHYVRKIHWPTGIVSTVFARTDGVGKQEHACASTAVEAPGSGCGGLSDPFKIATSTQVITTGLQTDLQGWLWLVNRGNASITRYKLNDLTPTLPGARSYGDVALHSDNDGVLPHYTGMPWTQMPNVTVLRGRFDHPLSIAVSPDSAAVYVGNSSSVRRVRPGSGTAVP